ncbi:hypothetical protein CHARACLAT_001150 [Characodon lateralis]|uniref:Uncharacterized protein n=1 Tax=Characodon lateralis TaxID=208331 RepID=A0ABU7EPW7_9TELE|nr:hypothetical protein [Characodon lateralis]
MERQNLITPKPGGFSHNEPGAMNWTSLNLRNEMANNTETRTPTQIQKDVLDLKVPEVSGFWIGNALFLGGGNKLKSAFHNVAVMLSIFFNVTAKHLAGQNLHKRRNRK